MTPKALGWAFLVSSTAVAALGLVVGRRRQGAGLGGRRLEEDPALLRTIEQADRTLPTEAARAMSDYVGMEASERSSGGPMLARRLEEAFTDWPAGESRVVREQLARSVQPVHAALRKRFGARIPLYRHQRAGSFTEPRRVLSWTLDEDVARWFAHLPRRRPTALSDAAISRIVDRYERTGRARYGRYEFRRSAAAPGYFDIYSGGQHVTDHNDLRRFLEDHRDWQVEARGEYDAARGRILRRDVPVEDVVWVTNRAGQNEFVVRARSGAAG